jgi:hypothetical protein
MASAIQKGFDSKAVITLFLSVHSFARKHKRMSLKMAISVGSNFDTLGRTGSLFGRPSFNNVSPF